MQFPHELFETTKKHYHSVHTTIQSLWGQPELDRELETLLERTPAFPREVRSELVEGYIVHKDHFTFANGFV